MLAVRSVLNEQLTHIKDNLIKLGSLTETAVFDAMNALERQDTILAQRVVRGDEEINHLCLDLKQHCLNVLATQHPKASDLRLVVATINMVTDLERIGDHAAGIARLVDRIQEEPVRPTLHHLPKMAKRARKMIRQSLQCFINFDAKRALRVIKRDDKLDRQYESFANLLIDEMNSHDRQATVSSLTYMLWIGHKLERIGDHVTNIAEQVIFAATGDMIEPND